MSDTLLDRLVLAVDGALGFDGNVVTAPIAALWPDEARQWEGAISRLQRRRRIVKYGQFDPANHQGPAYWLRCVIAATIDLEGLPDGLPIVYLPGISREALRSLDAVGPDLASLGALQHHCQWFSHPNGKDWTIRALLSNKERGLGLSVASDAATGPALVASLGKLVDQPATRLESKHIDAAFLNGLINPDPIRSLLNWLDNPAAVRSSLNEGAWTAFVNQCKHDFGFNPATHGEIEGARHLGNGEGLWAQVWARFCESPSDYPNIPDRLRQARPETLFTSEQSTWPQDNEAAEDQLRSRLLDFGVLTPEGARSELVRLEAEHGARRRSVWAQLDLAPLSGALEHLARMAEAIKVVNPGGNVQAIADWYGASGWHADLAVIRAIAEVETVSDVAAVSAAITAAYQPWLAAGAKALQSAVGSTANDGTYIATPAPKVAGGQVVVFVDGLRLDVAHLLANRLTGAGLDVAVDTALAALPTVTQTSKPVLVPIDQDLLAAGSGLDARRSPDGPAAGVQVLRGLMADAKVQVLDSTEVGDWSGVAWTETGAIDHRGHDLGIRLAHEIGAEVQRIAVRVEGLLEAGWRQVTIVTDHGWLLLPGGLPKCDDLPIAATETKKGRCARVKDGAAVTVPTVPWHWDRDVRIAIAPGISCFEANQTYEHGGVSPQECVVPRLAVRRGAGSTSGATITNMTWRGLALVVEFSGLPDRATIDLRTSAGDSKTSIAEMGRVTGGQGKVILLVGDDDLEGRPAQLVVIGVDGELLLQRETTVGQNR